MYIIIYKINVLKAILYTAVLLNVLYTFLYTNIKMVSLLLEEHFDSCIMYSLENTKLSTILKMK